MMELKDCTEGTAVVLPSGLLGTIKGPGVDKLRVCVQYKDGPPPWQPPNREGYRSWTREATSVELLPSLLKAG